MTQLVINDRDERNARAWGYDPELFSGYARDIHDVESGTSIDRKIKAIEKELTRYMNQEGLPRETFNRVCKNPDRSKDPKEALKEIYDVVLWELGKKRQEILYNSRVLVVGSDVLAQMILCCLTGMGVAGNRYGGVLAFMDNKRISDSDRHDFLCSHDIMHKGQKKVRHI